MSMLDFIVWTADPEVFHLDNFNWAPRWYGLMFAFGFLISQQILFYIFRSEGHKEEDVETLTIYMVIATIVGARLGHVLFYEPVRYLSNPLDILKIWEGGLASHGATIGILTALYVYSNYEVRLLKWEFKRRPRPGQSFLWVVDRIVIVVALTGAMIRFGNFMNSEIIGKPTNSDYGVVFARDLVDILERNPAIEDVEINAAENSDISATSSGNEASPGSEYRPVAVQITFKRGSQEASVKAYLQSQMKEVLMRYPNVNLHIYEPPDQSLDATVTQRRGAYVATINTFGIPRHPAQLYESGTTLLLFFLLFYLWSRMKEKTPEGLLFGLFLIILFSLRFVHEFFKENQVDWESQIPLNMGQLLSIPLIFIGFYLLYRVANRQKDKEKKV